MKVDHWAMGERELMCQWRVGTRNASMCGGRWEVETCGMMALSLWTSEDGRAPRVEPEQKPSTWAILRSPAGTDSPTRGLSPSTVSGAPAARTSGIATSTLPGARAGIPAVLSNGFKGLPVASAPVGSTAVPQRPSDAPISLKRSRLDMEGGAVSGSGSARDGFKSADHATDDAGKWVEDDAQEEPWLNAPRRENVGSGAGAGRNVRRRCTRGARADREPPPGGGCGSGSGSGGYRSADKNGGDPQPSKQGPEGITMTKMGTDRGREMAGLALDGGGAGVDAQESFVATLTGSMSARVNHSAKSGSSDGIGRGGRHRPHLGVGSRRGYGRLGKVVGVPRQAKAQDVRIVYDANAFAKELEVSLAEIPKCLSAVIFRSSICCCPSHVPPLPAYRSGVQESFGKEISPAPRTLQRAQRPRLRRVSEATP